MTQALLTPSQTAGPFLSLALRWPDGPDAVPAETPGSLWLRGRVLDAAGAVVPDALVETWQADVDGTYPHPTDPQWTGTPVTPGFRGFGRSETAASTPCGRWLSVPATARRTCSSRSSPAACSTAS